MTYDNLMAVVGFFILVMGSAWGIWWKIDASVKEKVKDARDDAQDQLNDLQDKIEKTSQELTQHKLHSAESYITKQGLRETTEQIMAAIHGVKSAVDNMTTRVDRIVENQNTPRPRRSSHDGV